VIATPTVRHSIIVASDSALPMHSASSFRFQCYGLLVGTDLLLAIGRTPNTDALDLEKTGVQTDEHGYIRVNQRLLTTCENVWAMGDCAGSPKFTHVSVNDFRILNAKLNGANLTTTARLVPFCMFTDLELARVGKNEAKRVAKALNTASRKCRWPKCCGRRRSRSHVA